MEDKKEHLSFVNKGELFIMPGLTVGKQEEYLEAIAEADEKEENTLKRNKLVNKTLLLKTLQIVDKTVTMKDIEKMHPSDYAYLTNILWTKGREINKDEPEDFQKTK